MSDESQAKELFLDALERAPGERSVFVRAQGGGDGARIARVHAILAAHEAADRRLGRPRAGAAPGELADGEASAR